jgi:hypothetical protein
LRGQVFHDKVFQEKIFHGNAFHAQPVPEDKFILDDEIAQESDPWGDHILKNLSQTAVARTLDPSSTLDPQDAAEDLATKGPNREATLPPSAPGRRAG